MLRALYVLCALCALACSFILPMANATATAQTRFSTSATTTTASVTPLYINFNSHNEEDDYAMGVSSTSSRSSSTRPRFTSYEDSTTFVTLRALIRQLADTVRTKGAKWDWQSDWRFLSGVLKYDRGDASTRGVNIVRWLADSNRAAIEVTPHAHETTYNYADVAHLFDSVGVRAALVVGGYTYNGPQATNGGRTTGYTWDSLAHGLQGRVFTWTTWTPQILWGGASGSLSGTSHSSDLNTLGVWKPQSTTNFFTHDASKTLTVLGNGYAPHVDSTTSVDSIVNQIVSVLDSLQSGLLPAGKMYTYSIDIHQKYYTSSGYIAKVGQLIDRLQSYVRSGRLVWATHTEKVQAWQTRYSSLPNYYPYTEGMAVPSSSSSPSGSTTSLPASGSSTSLPPSSITSRVYPNPASSTVTVELSGSITTAQLRLLSSMGTVVASQTVSGSATLDVSSFMNGSYIVELSSGTAMSRTMLLVQH
jgi:hypothetical protein